MFFIVSFPNLYLLFFSKIHRNLEKICFSCKFFKKLKRKLGSMDVFLYSSLGLGSLMTIYNLGKSVSQLTDKFENIYNSKNYNPEEISLHLEGLKNQDLSENKEFYIDPKNPKELIGNVFLNGVASSPFPINSILRGNIPLIYSNYYINKIYSRNLNAQNGSLIPEIH